MVQDIDVLLLDAECRQALACMRAYARGGLRVGAVACESEADWAPSFRSRSCSLTAAVPAYTTQSDAYVDALLSLVDLHQPHMLLPAHDGSIEALRARRAEVEARVTLPLGSESALDVAVSKTRTLALATELEIAIPRGIPIDNLDDAPSALRAVGFPAVLKPERSWVGRPDFGVRLSSMLVCNLDEAMRTLEWVFALGERVLAQQYLPGRREAVSLFYARDHFWARMAQASHREWPILGGVSVLCESIPLLTDITDASERLVRAMDLEGCSMVEFRRDLEGRPVLMEVNPRIGGSVGLAIAAGIDFPKLLYDWKVTGKMEESGSYRVGRRLRWLAGDFWNLKSVWESQGHPDVPSRRRATADFLLDFVRPANDLDVAEFNDMRPMLAEMNKFVLRHGLRRVQQLPPINWLASAGKVN